MMTTVTMTTASDEPFVSKRTQEEIVPEIMPTPDEGRNTLN
jgi:hypothetical protein